MYYIYTLDCPIDGESKYVGCTKNPKTRLSGHMATGSENKRKNAWIKELKSVGLKPVLTVRAQTDFIDEAILLEESVYNEYNKGQLFSIPPRQREYMDWRDPKWAEMRGTELSWMAKKTIERKNNSKPTTNNNKKP